MNTDEQPAQAETTAYGSKTTDPTEGFHPAVIAKSRVDAVGHNFLRSGLQNAKHKPTEDELIRISGEMITALSDDDEMELSLRTQSALINAAFTALLLKTTSYDSFNEDTFAAALRAQRQYRITCKTLQEIKKSRERTDMTPRKSPIPRGL